MSHDKQNLGGRLSLVDPASLTGNQQEMYDLLTANWVSYAKDLGVQATTADGRLIGPFNFLLLHPEVSRKLSDFQVAEAKYTTLPKRVRQIAILMVGAVWAADYEIYAQRPAAHRLGFSRQAIDALAANKIPDDLSEDEKLAARLTQQLLTLHRVDEETYRTAEQAFGTKGLFDLIAVIGEYQTVCGALALFEVPVPRNI